MWSNKWGSSGLVACSEEKGGERRTGRYDESVTFRLFTAIYDTCNYLNCKIYDKYFMQISEDDN